MKTPKGDEGKMTLTQAAGYLGISLRKMSQMVKDGEVQHTVDPLDRRRKLISVKQLNDLRSQSLGKGSARRA